MSEKVWTQEEIREKLESDQAWLERGIVAIYNFQTSYEQQVEHTRDFNNVGFNGVDSHYLTYAAKWLLSGKHLSGKHVYKARKQMLKYSGQLARIANKEQ